MRISQEALSVAEDALKEFADRLAHHANQIAVSRRSETIHPEHITQAEKDLRADGASRTATALSTFSGILLGALCSWSVSSYFAGSLIGVTIGLAMSVIVAPLTLYLIFKAP